MIVYNATKQQFDQDVIMNQIADKILENLRSRHLSGGQEA